MVLTEYKIQYLRRRAADRGMRARIRWIRRRIGRQRQPVRVPFSLWIVVQVGCPDRGYRPPEPVSVFGVVERDHGISQAQVQKRKHPCASLNIQFATQYRALSDLVPIVLD